MITIFRSTLTDVQVAIILTSLIVMTSSTSWYYYAIFSIPALLAITQVKFEKKTFGPNKELEQTPISRKIDLVLWCALVLTLVQLPLGQLASNETIIVTSANLVGGFWISAYILIFVTIVKARAKSKTETKPQKDIF
jgi:hypothetical protein